MAETQSDMVRRAVRRIQENQGHPSAILKSATAEEALCDLLSNIADAMEEHEKDIPTPILTHDYCADERLAARFAELVL